VLSRDAGAYLCNYLCWHAAHAARLGGPPIAAFVHVPSVDRARWIHARRFRITQEDLMRAGEAMIRAIVPLLR